MKTFKGILLEKGSIDSDGIMISEDCEITLPKHPMLLKYNFDDSTPTSIIGEVNHLKIDKAKITADLSIYDKEMDLLYPAIGGVIVKSHIKEGVRVIDKFNLTSVSLCDTKNKDEEIKSIGEQQKEFYE